MRDLEHGDIMVFIFSHSAVCTSGVQEQQQATHACCYDQQQQRHGDPQLQVRHIWGFCCPFPSNIWRDCGVGVALVLFAATNKEARDGGVALLQVEATRETAPLLIAILPGVETDVSSAGSIYACAFGILTCTQQLPFFIGVCMASRDPQKPSN